MKRFTSSGFVAAAVLATAALGAAPAAQAHTDVYFSVGIPGLPVYVEQAPVYVRPAPVYLRPEPVYAPPRRVDYVQPPAYTYERPWRPSYESEFERERAWRRAEFHRRQWEHRHHEWDRFPSHGRDRD